MVTGPVVEVRRDEFEGDGAVVCPVQQPDDVVRAHIRHHGNAVHFQHPVPLLNVSYNMSEGMYLDAGAPIRQASGDDPGHDYLPFLTPDSRPQRLVLLQNSNLNPKSPMSQAVGYNFDGDSLVLVHFEGNGWQTGQIATGGYILGSHEHSLNKWDTTL